MCHGVLSACWTVKIGIGRGVLSACWSKGVLSACWYVKIRGCVTVYSLHVVCEDWHRQRVCHGVFPACWSWHRQRVCHGVLSACWYVKIGICRGCVTVCSLHVGL